MRFYLVDGPIAYSRHRIITQGRSQQNWGTGLQFCLGTEQIQMRSLFVNNDKSLTMTVIFSRYPVRNHSGIIRRLD